MAAIFWEGHPHISHTTVRHDIGSGEFLEVAKAWDEATTVHDCLKSVHK